MFSEILRCAIFLEEEIMHTVSVILTSYNHADYIAAIQSVLSKRLRASN